MSAPCCPGPAQSLRQRVLPTGSAVLVMLSVHALLLAGLLHGPRWRPDGERDEHLRLRWVPAARPTAVRPATAQRPDRSSAVTVRPGRHGTQPTETLPMQAAASAESAAQAAALDLRLPAELQASAAIDAAMLTPKMLGRRDVHRAFAPPPQRFRIRPGFTPEQILHGVAQVLGLWPPGYKVGTCELARQDMDYFQNAVEETERQLLRDAVQQVSARCR